MATSPITINTTLIHKPRTTIMQALNYFLHRDTGEYLNNEVQWIVFEYFAVCKQAKLDPLLVLSQMSLETAHLSSAWAARPKCNPAGIGVTGTPGAGVVFKSWHAAVPAHVGRLTAYAVKKEALTPVQANLVSEALAWRPLPDTKRGSAPTLRGLAQSWAADPRYATSIARTANEILGL